MKIQLSNEFKVGITVIISTLILIFGIIWGKEFRIKTNKYHLDVMFDKVGGLVPGDPVTVNGVREGKVTNVGWQGRKVLCTVEVNDHVQLYEDATFIVISSELLAGMKIEVFPGESNRRINLSHQPFEEYGGRIVDVGIVFGELAENFPALSFRIDTTVTMINGMLHNGALQDDIKSSVSNLNKMTNDLRTFPGELKNTLKILDTTTMQLNTLLENNGEGINTTVRNLSLISTRLDTISLSTQSLLQKINNQEGTLGRMVYDTTLYSNLTKTLVSIDSLAKQIKQDGLDIDLF